MDVQINQRVEFIVDDPTPNESSSFISRVEDCHKNTLAIAAPSKQGVIMGWPKGTKGHLVYYVDNYRYQGRYRIPVTVQSLQQHPIALLWLKREGPVEKIQERAFLRVETLIVAQVYFTLNGEARTSRGIITELSGASLILVMPILLNQNQPLRLTFTIDNIPLEIHGIVTKVRPERSIKLYIVTLLDLDESQQQTIIKYVLHKQLQIYHRLFHQDSTSSSNQVTDSSQSTASIQTNITTQSQPEKAPPLGNQPEPSPEVVELPKTQELARLIDSLPYDQRLILALYYHEKLTIQEIAFVTELSMRQIIMLHNHSMLYLAHELGMLYLLEP